MARDVQQEIKDLVTNNRVVLFMKGNKLMPQCGFSARAVQVLTQHTNDFTTVNVLQDMEIRQGIKEFGNWPTIPQLYIDGELVGGSDIIFDMHTSGELADLINGKAAS